MRTFASEAVSPAADRQGREGQPVRVLVVDDEPGVLGLLAEGLKPAEVVTVSSRAACLAAVAAGPPFDWAVLDVRLRDGDGYALACELVRSGFRRDRIVLTTGLDDALPPFRVLRKPFPLTELRRLVAG
jgi:CheY-like chemotaxis protein